MTLAVTVELGTGALLLYGIPFIVIVGWFSSRILGVRRGWGRSLVAGFCVKNLTDDFLHRHNGVLFWALNGMLVGFARWRLADEAPAKG